MENPFRSEEAAFRFLLLTIAAFAAIAVAGGVGGGWWGAGVAAGMAVAATVGILRARDADRAPRPPVHGRRRSAEGERRILVIANETVAGRTLLDEIRTRSAGVREEVLVVTPALNSPLRHWASDEDRARAEAQQRLSASLTRLREAGIDAKGEVGDAEPLQAMEDALRLFGADEIIISTHPEGRSHWLERGIVEGARARFAVPITHVVVDLEAEREEVR